MGIDFEGKAFYDILNSVAKKYEFEYPEDKMIELSKSIKIVVDDKARYTDQATHEDSKANLQVDLILLLDEFDYPPVTYTEQTSEKKKIGLCLPYTVMEDIALSLCYDYISPEFPASWLHRS